jgi:hypothetical protein
VFDDGKSLDIGRVVGGKVTQRAHRVSAGEGPAAAGGVRRSKWVEKGPRGCARLEAFASLERIFGTILVGAANNGRRGAVREELRTDLEANDERDRERPTPEDNLRKDEWVALHDVARALEPSPLR